MSQLPLYVFLNFGVCYIILFHDFFSPVSLLSFSFLYIEVFSSLTRLRYLLYSSYGNRRLSPPNLVPPTLESSLRPNPFRPRLPLPETFRSVWSSRRHQPRRSLPYSDPVERRLLLTRLGPHSGHPRSPKKCKEKPWESPRGSTFGNGWDKNGSGAPSPDNWVY